MEYVLNISIADTHRLCAFSDFSESPVFNDVVDGHPAVVMSKQGTLSALDDSDIASSRLMPSATAFIRTVEGTVLSFFDSSGKVVNEQTGSTWNLLGRATWGAYVGTQLDTVPSGVHFAFAWLAFNPDSEIYGR
tara:strand:+ start:902 stop:1303 length:402 start_codon:yes stop_codon:yes gene_type:complete